MQLKIEGLTNGDETQEKIRLVVHEDCNLKNFILADETYDTAGAASNLHRHTFWFPNQAVKKGDTVTVATGKGTHTTTKSGTATTYKYYWGLGEAVWNNEGDKAVLLKVTIEQTAGFQRKKA